MTRISAVIVASLLAIGCGLEPEPIDPPPAELAEICGAAGPVRVLRFEPWRVVRSAQQRGVFGERRLVRVAYDDTKVASTTLWSVGLCGEAPRQLASGNFDIWTLPPYELPFICESGQISVLDPTGERASRPVFETGSQSCFVARTEAGLVNIRPDTVDGELGSLTLLPWADDVWTDEVEPVVLLEDVRARHASPGTSDWQTVQPVAGGVLVITGDDELVHVSLPDGAVELIAAGARTFRLSWEPDDSADGFLGRFVLWQRVALSNDDPEDPEGELMLLDRTTGEQRSLGHGGLHWMRFGSLSWIDSGLLAQRLRVDDQVVLRLFRLPSFEYVDVEATLEPRYMLADGHSLLVEVSEDARWGRLDIRTGDSWAPSGPWGVSYWWERRAATVLVPGRELFLLTGEGPLERIAKRAGIVHELLPDDRLLTRVNLRDGSSGLIVVDPSTLEERLIDRGVTSFSHEWSDDDEVVSYSVVDGDRSGFWLTRLHPRE